jgi:integrase
MLSIRERNGRHQAQVRIKQAGHIVFQESATFDTERQARTWGEALEKKLEREGMDSRKSSTSTIKDVVDLHEATLLKAGKDIRGSSSSMRALRESSFADKPIGNVKSGDIAQWVKNDYADGRAPATVLHALMTLRSAYRTATNMFDIPADVSVVANATAQLVRLGLAGKSTERERRVTDDEIDRIVTHHERLSGVSIPLRIIAHLAVALPRRRTELLTMRWEYYNGVQVKLLDTKDPTKVRNELIPVPPSAKAILDALPILLTGIMLPYNPQSVSTAFHRAAALLGINDLHFHDLRHEGISRLFAQGLNIPEVAMISGHTSWATLKRYTHLKPSDVLDKLKAEVQTKKIPLNP